MKWLSGGSSRWALLLAFLLVGSSSWCQQASEPKPFLSSQTQTISQLKDNLTQALVLCTTLKANLDLQIVSYSQLRTLYERLVQDQQSLEQSLTDSEKQLSLALQDYKTIKDLSDRLQVSLDEASKRLATYKEDTARAVRDVELQREGWKIAGVTFGVVATIEGVVLVGHALHFW